MGFWDMFSDKSKSELPPGKKTPYYGDLSKTDILYKLFSVAKDKRDVNWQQQFLANVADAAFRAADPQVIKGPDGFPYFILFLPGQYQAFDAFVIRKMTYDFLLEAGYGVVINPKGNDAEWVFSYGDIVNFHLHGEFYTTIIQPPSSQQAIENVVTGKELEQFLPLQARSVMRDFLQSVGISKPRFILMNKMLKGQPLQQLAFDLYPRSFPTNRHFEFTMSHLPWFLPRHYQVITLTENNQFENQFTDL